MMIQAISQALDMFYVFNCLSSVSPVSRAIYHLYIIEIFPLLFLQLYLLVRAVVESQCMPCE